MTVSYPKSFLFCMVLFSLETIPADEPFFKNASVRPLDFEVDIGNKILSRQKRNYGGSEAIDYDKAFSGIFGPAGLLVQGCEVFLDIVWHVSGYTILAGAYNFNEPRTDPSKIRQKYLDQFFGPTAIALSALRAFRNPLFSFSMRFFLDFVFLPSNTTEYVQNLSLASYRDTVFSEAWLHGKIYRDASTFFFCTIGWTTYYIVWKFSINQQIIMGRKKRSTNDMDLEEMENMLGSLFEKLTSKMEEVDSTTINPDSKEKNYMENYFAHGGDLSDLIWPNSSHHGKEFGDYQYYLSFGGDQYFDFPLAIDSTFGTRGVYVQFCHFISQLSYEVAGHTAIGFMYNGVYRTEIHNQDVRKFLDTFVGPTTSTISMLRYFRNGFFGTSLRWLICLFLPLTRERTLFMLRTISASMIKAAIFNEGFLHPRIFRHVFEYGCSAIGMSTLYAVFRYKKAFLDPLKSKQTNSSVSTTTTIAPNSSSKKPSLRRQGLPDYENLIYETDFIPTDHLESTIIKDFNKVLENLNSKNLKAASWSN